MKFSYSFFYPSFHVSCRYSRFCFLLLMIPASYIGIAQKKSLDTLYANEQMQVALFFPKPIQQAITGASQMSFTYNKDYPQQFGVLKATPGKSSNLLVIDQDQNVYSFLLQYQSTLSTLNYFFTLDDAIFKLKDTLTATNSLSNLQIASYDSLKAFKKFARYLLDRDLKVMKRTHKDGMRMKLYTVQYFNEKAFIKINLSNRSEVSFRPGEITISLQTKKQGKRKSMQRQLLPIDYKLQVPEIIYKGDEFNFILMVPKFTIPKNWQLTIEIKENGGRRNIQLVKKKAL
ncbi:DUF4138 domain-containing protein [Zunongwangia endophytica]|uniref:DUF4138 domain-containing protein n=1 Tax=Zunongwangia endophytica TaxID=1808945 RepID=A0ABV8H8X1_9FLAO|nr:DUF4138 domain-containing protein [Zunongwangia endophytica]MDN3594369.1 DUF4138 domain-containing protein [Zunongwangia endophytica]